ncbi:MAG TPA: hypothetical protein VFY38_13920 [Pseudonocardia sp.]|nr:hypothetical protein [Pseudonocardia sp.]
MDRVGGHGDADPLVEAGDAASLRPLSAVDPLFGPLELIAPVDSDPTEARQEGSSLRGGGWLEAAPAELDRVWGRPLPELDASHRASAAERDAAADVAAEGPAACLGVELPDDGVTGEHSAADPGIGRDAVGCVVTVDVLRAGAQVRDRELLDAVGERLDAPLPTDARLRFEADGSAVSVVLPGWRRSDATEWMHRTLPAVFAEVAGAARPARPTGTSLRAASHDTDGPVGAQLLQRLDLGTAKSGARRARQDDIQPPLTVRWGVPIRAGSGGRHRQPADGSAAHRPDDDTDVPRADGDLPAGATGRLQAKDGPRAEGDRSAGVAGHRDMAGDPASPTGRLQAKDGPRAEGDRSAGAAGQPAVGSDVRVGAAGQSLPPDVQAPADHRGSTGDEEAFSVEGLGLADLLAGALAAYRGI